MSINFIPIRVFRKTPQVSFFGTSVKGSNGADIVIHHKNSISPPNDGNFEEYYIHHHMDNNLMIEGNRTFTLIKPKWDEPHHIFFFKSTNGCSSNTYWDLSSITSR